ncbi:MAG: N-acetyltransferase [Bacteroidales bacterium]|nr:N-acetyltransferase [Bacteroidales bacterium]
MLSFRKEVAEQDIPLIRKMLKETHFFDDSADEIDVAIELVETVISGGNNVENYRIIIAEECARVVGYICYARVPCTVSTYEFYWLCVDRTCQGHGIGRHLIDEALNEIAALKGLKVVLQTAGREQYKPTQMFYKACGFIEEARLKDYFAKGDDCLIFTFPLSL